MNARTAPVANDMPTAWATRSATARWYRARLDAALRLTAVVASAALWTLCFPPADLGALAWVALVPLLWACDGVPARRAALLGAIFGALSSLAVFRWLTEAPAVGAPQMAVLAAYVSIYPALWCMAMARLGRSRLPLVLTAPALWVTLDALKGHAGFLALPWATLAHSQHQNLALLQWASIAGEAAIGFAVVGVNVALARWLRRPQSARERRTVVAAVSTVLVLHAVGLRWLDAPLAGRPLTVAAVQPAFPATRDGVWAEREQDWQRLETLTREAASVGPALIVWPETVVADPARDAGLAERLQNLARAAQAALVVGTSDTAKFAEPADGGLTIGEAPRHNAAHIVTPFVPAQPPYHKRRLVPFAEEAPAGGRLRWPTWLVPSTGRIVPGTQPRVWTLSGGTRIASLICWENLFASLAREAVGDGAQLLVQLTDDAWFGTSAASRQHNVASVLRAVENGVPVVIASNAGPSQVIDSHGRVVAQTLVPWSPSIVVAAPRVGGPGSFYARTGDWFVLLAACLSGAAVIGAWRATKGELQ